MPTTRIHLTLPEELLNKGELLASKLHKDFSAFIQQLILEEWERRAGPIRVLPEEEPSGDPKRQDRLEAKKKPNLSKVEQIALDSREAAMRVAGIAPQDTAPPNPQPKRGKRGQGGEAEKG